MNNYELTLILRVGESLESLKNTVTELMAKHSVAVQEKNEWGSRKLAYPIDGETDGFYTLYTLQAPAQSVQKITSEFRLLHDILRFMFVRLSEKGAAE
jgi:small subunit ribosomal protein S6